MIPFITGKIDNGSTGFAEFPFYSGPVGIRTRPGAMTIEVAYRGEKTMLEWPVTGTLDGKEVKIVSVTPSRADPQMMVAVVASSPSASPDPSAA